MIIVDTSVWIDYFNDFSSKEADFLDSLLGRSEIGILDIILLEVLQGFKTDAAFRKAKELLGEFPVMESLGRELAQKGALNFRVLRRRGRSIRSTVDTVIATYCIENGHSLLFKDKDFLVFEKELGLRVVR